MLKIKKKLVHTLPLIVPHYNRIRDYLSNFLNIYASNTLKPMKQV